MIILFEGHHYQTEVLESYGLDSYIYTSRDSDQSFIPYVGYFYSSKIDDAIFILPKVFLFEGENSKKESYGPVSYTHLDVYKRQVYDSGTRGTYQLKSASHKEFRVNQLGEFYRNNEVKEGDEVWITKVVKGDHEFISIKVAKYNRVIIDVNNNGATIGDITRLSSYGTKTNGYSCLLYTSRCV